MNLMMTVLGAFLAAPPPLKRWGRMRCVWVRKRGVGESLQTQVSPPDPTKKQKEDGADWPCNCKNICALLHLKQP